MTDPKDLGRFRWLDDEQLIRMAAELDPRALEVLYERHHVLAFSFAVRIVGSSDRAQVVVYESFLALWHDAGRYDPTRGPVRTWLISMVHDQAIDTVRRLSIRERTEADAAARAIASDESGLAGRQADARATPAVRAALQALPEDERQIVELAYYGGWTQDEIADMLELPLDAVRSSARAGLLKLRDALLSELEAPS